MSKHYITTNSTIIVEHPHRYIDAETGDEIFVNEIMKRIDNRKNFWKCYLMDFLSILGIIDSKQLDIFVYIVENTNPSNNIFIGTYKEISENVHVSQPTISKIMKKLQENNFVKMKHPGVWAINPNILMRGNDNKRQMLLSYYCDDDKKSGIETETGRIEVNHDSED